LGVGGEESITKEGEFSNSKLSSLPKMFEDETDVAGEIWTPTLLMVKFSRLFFQQSPKSPMAISWVRPERKMLSISMNPNSIIMSQGILSPLIFAAECNGVGPRQRSWAGERESAPFLGPVFRS
jgi:hypothetical protein